MAQLQGADLRNAQLQGASLQDASLQGAHLNEARLQGAKLLGAALQGADLRSAHLQGADLGKAKLQGGDLRYTDLYGAYLEQSTTELIDLRGARWTPLEKEQLKEMRMLLTETITDTLLRRQRLDQIEFAGKAGLPPILTSCLIDRDVMPILNCKGKWLPGQIDAFRSELFPMLETLACQSSWITGGLVQQIDQRETTSGRFGLAGRFVTLLDKRECDGLSSLPEGIKNQNRDLANREKEERLRQSGVGKPAGQVSASSPPPPAIAPETP